MTIDRSIRAHRLSLTAIIAIMAVAAAPALAGQAMHHAMVRGPLAHLGAARLVAAAMAAASQQLSQAVIPAQRPASDRFEAAASLAASQPHQPRVPSALPLLENHLDLPPPGC